MADSLSCRHCSEPLGAGEVVCPRCGHLTAEAAPTPSSGLAVEWRDGGGQEWRLEADPQRLCLVGAEQRFDLPRADWKSAITFSPAGGKVVIHIDTGDREIGFMVSLEEARRLFTAMGRRTGGAQAPQAPADERHFRYSATTQRGGPMWPKMRPAPIVALFLSVLAFLPVIGVVFALVAVVFAVYALRRSRANAAEVHVRVMAKISILLSFGGLLICALATHSLSQQAIDAGAAERLEGVEMHWDWGAAVAAVVMVLIALSVHEAAHAITALWCGDDYARSLGRVTLNPLAHIDPFGTVLLPLMLFYAHLPIFGYARPVPVRLGGVRRFRLAHILVSAAGPASNLLQAAICLALLLLIGCLLGFAPESVKVTNLSSIQPIVEIEGLAGGRILAAVILMLKLGFQVNLMLAFFNMIPIPPLDGSWIAEHLSPNFVGKVIAAVRPYGFLLFLALLYTGVLTYLMLPAYLLTVAGLLMVTLVTGL